MKAGFIGAWGGWVQEGVRLESGGRYKGGCMDGVVVMVGKNRTHEISGCGTLGADEDLVSSKL
jgi:hypothetical protein